MKNSLIGEKKSMINFNKLHLNEGGTEATDTAIASSEKAKEGGEKQVNNTVRRREQQKAHMSQQGSTPVKSDVSYTSEEYRSDREYTRMMEAAKVDWRQEIMEASLQ